MRTTRSDTDPDRITVGSGKYTLVMEPTRLRALRYGEEWRSLIGDGFVMALGHEIQALRKVEAALRKLMACNDVYELLDGGARPSKRLTVALESACAALEELEQ